MIRRPPRSTRTDTLFPVTTLFRSHAVNRRRRSINQMRDGPVARQFENIDMPRDVRMDIGGRVFERIADGGLSAELADPLNGVAGERVGERVGVAKIDTDKRSEEHRSELQSLMRHSYAFFCLKKKKHHPQ